MYMKRWQTTTFYHFVHLILCFSDFAYQFAYDNYGEDDDRQSLVTDTSGILYNNVNKHIFTG